MAEVLRTELQRPSWRREHVALGTNTDPYQWAEGRYELMRGIWAALRDHENPCSVLTKSPLLTRDIDLMLQIAARTRFTAYLSVPTIDERAWRESEPRTPNPRARLEAMRQLADAGLDVGVVIAPLMPGINDSPEQIEEIVAAAEDAGAESIDALPLHLRGATKQVFLDWLRGTRPELVAALRGALRRRVRDAPGRAPAPDTAGHAARPDLGGAHPRALRVPAAATVLSDRHARRHRPPRPRSDRRRPRRP